MGLENIKHVVVLMFENRSFDNLLGWLYDNDTNPPKQNIPPQNPPVFHGLKENTYSNLFSPDSTEKLYVGRPTSSWPSCPNCNQVPTPDPHEEFKHVTFQLFGTETPTPDAKADMSGFLANYATTDATAASAKQILQTYGPDEANVINDLARSFAVCDMWFASVPSQTWPNRGFVHSGSSDGHVNNDLISYYSNKTIYNVLEEQGKTWTIYYDSLVTSLTGFQFARLHALKERFHRIEKFEELCAAAADADASEKLPQYSFIEPRFAEELFEQPQDYHPPHNICRGEQFLQRIYDAIRNCKYRDDILFIVTFDEHGGCYDHVPPPTGAAEPEPGPVAVNEKFRFDRFGVRVPAIVVSSYVEPGTVFRAAEGQTPYDHTSILATVRDWLNLAAVPDSFLPSPRIAAAPTVAPVLTRQQGEERDWPEIIARCSIDGSDVSPQNPLNDVQRSIVAADLIQNKGIDTASAAEIVKNHKTYAHGASALELKPGEHEY